MSSDNDSDVRLAELIWRTVKLRVSLLVLTNLVLLVVWSSMANGKKQAAAVDVEFCKQLVAEQNETTPAVKMSDTDWCTASGARSFVEGTRATNGLLLKGWESLYQDEATREGADKILKMYSKKNQILNEYDTKRRDAFPLQVQLSPEYSGSSIVLNGQFAATLLPFCALIIFSIVLVLGFQQISYKRQLESSLLPAGYADTSDRATRIARGQFFAGLDTGSRFGNWGLISPETLTIGCLYLLFGVALFSVVVSVISDLVHLTDSVLISYPAALLALAFALALFLSKTRRRYTQLFPRPSATRERRTRWSFVMFHWKEAALAVVGLISLLLPWARGIASLRGYNFILRQHGTVQLAGIVSFPIDPKLFLELRVQIVVAVAFVLVCGIHAVLSVRQYQVSATLLARVQYPLAVVVFFLILNYLSYMGILEYGVNFAANPWPSLMSTVTGDAQAFGFPMVFFDPAYGFIVFVASCLGLIWLSIRDRHFIH